MPPLFGEMTMDRKKRTGYLLVILAVTLACVPALPSVAPLPTQPVGAVDTIIAATYGAASTNTALVGPTSTFTPEATFTPSLTPTITPTGTATVIFHYYTPTKTRTPKGGTSGGTSGGGGGGGGGGAITPLYQCEVIEVIPANGSIYPPGANIGTITWLVKNTSTIAWDHNSVDYRFYGGVLITPQKLYDLPNNLDVGPTKEVYLFINDAVAPTQPGSYATVWEMKVGDTEFCKDLKFLFSVVQ